MKSAATSLTIVLALIACCASFATPASAALRAPQVTVLGGSLQAYFNGVGESINVLTQQQDVQSFGHTTSSTTTYTIMLESSPNANVNNVSMYDGSSPGVPTLDLLLPGALLPSAFATATFLPGNQMTVNRFDDNGILVGSATFGGVNQNNFAFAISGPNGTFYTQDVRNPGGKAQALAFAGTGGNTGTWWLCFEENSVAAGSDQDFDDCVILMESVNPTPVHRTSWGEVKTRFR